MKELQMKLSEQTIKVLKNYSTINQGLVFKKGNVISTMSPQKNILSEATLSDDIPQDFAIYNLNEFLSVLSLNKDPDVEFDGKNAVIKFLNGRSKISYRFTEESMVVSPPDKKITLPSVDVEFTLTEEDLAWLLKTSAVLGSPNIAVSSNGETVSIVTFDVANDAAHTNSITLDIPTTSSYKLIFKTDNLKLIPGTYLVQISSKGIAHFNNPKENIQYWIATEAGSSYGS